MSPTTPHFANPNAKTVTAVTTAVLALHALVGVGLMLMPTVALKPVTVTPPLEIEFVKPPEPAIPTTNIPPTPVEPPTPTEPLPPAKTVVEKPTPVKTVLPTDSKSPVKVEQPIATELQPPTVEPVPTEPKNLEPIKTEPTQPKDIPPEPTVSKTVADQPTVKNTPVAPTEPVEPFAHMVQPDDTAERQKAEQAQREQTAREKAEREATEKAERAKAEQAKAEREKAQQAEIERQAREQAEREKTAREQAEKAEQANRKPVNFGAGDAKWKSRPNIKLTGNLAKIAQQQQLTRLTVQLSVAVNGSITNVTIVESSGDSQIDGFFQQRLRSAKLQPFTQNGVPVAGTVTLPIQIQ